MAQSLTDFIIHTVFSTKERKPFVNAVIEQEFHGYICEICHNLECPAIKINGVEDYVHLLLSIDRIIAISKLVNEIKLNSSRLNKNKDRQLFKFSWQAG